MIRRFRFSAGQSPTGRTAPVTEILGAGALPLPVEKARAMNAMRNLAFAQAELMRFLTEGPQSPRFTFREDIAAPLAIALHSVLDIERGRLEAWDTPAAHARARRLTIAADHLMPALAAFEKEWARG